MKKTCFILCGVAGLLAQYNTIISKNSCLYVGSVQFPPHMTYVDPLRIFYKGQAPKTDSLNSAKKVNFTIQADHDTSVFYLLITSAKVVPVKVRKMAPDVIQNTIAYFKLKPSSAYKFYKMSVVKEVQVSEDLSGKKKKKNVHTWRVEGIKLPKTGRIPDDAIIVPLNAQWVKGVVGGSSVELPRITIKNDVAQTKESEKMMHDEMTRALLTSLDVGALHTQVRQENRGDLTLKTIIALAT